MVNQLAVTAIIPVHNHENWVQDAILSVANQNYENLKFVIVDDASTDNSFSKILELVDGLKDHAESTHQDNEPAEIKSGLIKGRHAAIARFRKNQGPAITRNYAANTAKDVTDVYAFLDSDDIYLPGKIEKSIKYFYNPFVGVVYSDYETVNVHTGLIARQFKESYRRDVLLHHCIVNCDSLVSKQAFYEAGGFNEQVRVTEDYSLWLEISKKHIICHIPECLLRIKIGSHSSTAKISEEDWKKDMMKTRLKYQNAH
ncbi:MAG TPA: glycosyltransferase [Nitrososphaeraceae archaeon]|nr:glycosyltransferase [Nitrososphaeraceae archaeon]